MRKIFLKIFVLSVFLFVTLFFSFSWAQEKITISIGHDQGVGSIQQMAVQRIVEVANEMSKGRLELREYPACQLGTNMSMLEAVIIGSQDIIWCDLAWLGNFVSDYKILNMGYCFRDQEHMHKFMDSELGQELKKQLLDKGLLLVREHANALPRVMTSVMPISTIEDIQGIKMRVPGIPIFLKVWEALGTKPTMVNWGEVYLALSQGVVEALECNFEFIVPNKFYEFAKYVTLTNHVRGLRGMIVNPKKFNSLPKDLQDILVEAAIEGEKLYNEKLENVREEHAKILKNEGVTISEIEMEPFKVKILPIADDLENEGFWSKGLYNKVQAIK